MDVLYDRKKPKVLGSNWSVPQKAAVLKAAPSVVGITTLDIPAEMTAYGNTKRRRRMMNLSHEQVFMGSGIVIESKDVGGCKFFNIILTTANLFIRSNGIQPTDVKVLVYGADGTLYESKLLACDFHYNLATVMIQSDTPLQVAKIKVLDDIIPIYETESTRGLRSFQLRHHSSLFKLCEGDMVGALGRRFLGKILVTLDSISVDYPKLDCKELYSLDVDHEWDRGGPAINCHGEVIGIMVADRYFLPSNVVMRWWEFYKKHRNFCRPWLGMKVANLHAASEKFLGPFLVKFPTFLSGVIVTEVAQNAPACCSGLCNEDVIVQCDGAPVRSTLELFEQTWDKTGASVDLTVLRVSSGDCLNLKLTVDSAIEDNFYRWPVPEWLPKPVSSSEIVVFEGPNIEEMFNM